MRPDVVLFTESLPANEWRRASQVAPCLPGSISLSASAPASPSACTRKVINPAPPDSLPRKGLQKPGRDGLFARGGHFGRRLSCRGSTGGRSRSHPRSNARRRLSLYLLASCTYSLRASRFSLVSLSFLSRPAPLLPVTPAPPLPRLSLAAIAAGVPVVEINLDPSPISGAVTVYLHGRASETLPQLVHLVLSA